MPLSLNGAQTASLLSLDDAMASAREAFVALANDQATMPQRLAVRVEAHQGTHLSMPCYVRTEEREILCTKLATVFEENASRGLPTTMAYLVLQDPETGELLALMDAEALTALRTAAASALAVDLLAPADADTLTVIGAGGQAEAHIRALLQIRPISRIFIVGRNQERVRALAGKFAGAESAPDPRQAVEESRVVVVATNSKTPVLHGSWLREDAAVAAVGAFRPDMQEVDQTAVERSFIVVDRLQAAQNGAGDLIQAGIDWAGVCELGDLLLGRASPASTGPYLFKSVGLAVQDAFAAAKVYENAVKRQVGDPIAFS